MKSTILLFLFSLINFNSFGQDKNNSIKMTSEYLTANSDVNDLLTFEGIDFYEVRFTGSELKGKKISFLVKEIWNGEITKVDTLINSQMSNRIGELSSEELKFKVLGKRINDNQIKMMFRFPWFQMDRKFQSTNSEFYSLRDVGVDFKIKPGEPFYALAYILPYEKNGVKNWCAVDKSGENIEDWGKEFGLEHYLIFEMNFK